MDSKTWMQAVSEAKVSADLALNHFDVFNQETGKAPFDKVAYKNGRILRISVKSCLKEKDGKYRVQLKTTRSKGVKFFDKNSCDYVAIYLFDIDKICYIPSQDILGKSEIYLRTETSSFVNKNVRQFVIKDFTNVV